jgi:hypothetical protein
MEFKASFLKILTIFENLSEDRNIGGVFKVFNDIEQEIKVFHNNVYILK